MHNQERLLLLKLKKKDPKIRDYVSSQMLLSMQTIIDKETDEEAVTALQK